MQINNNSKIKSTPSLSSKEIRQIQNFEMSQKYCKPLELYNGCPSNKSIRCDDGRCVQNESDCNKNPSCTNDKPYLCNNGECNDNCDNILYSECKENEIHCPNGKCVSNDKLYIQPEKMP